MRLTSCEVLAALVGLSDKDFIALPIERRTFWRSETRKVAAMAGDEEESGEVGQRLRSTSSTTSGVIRIYVARPAAFTTNPSPLGRTMPTPLEAHLASTFALELGRTIGRDDGVVALAGRRRKRCRARLESAQRGKNREASR